MSRTRGFRSGLIGPDGNPWLGTSDGIRRREGGRWIEELPGITIYPETVDESGAVWAGSASDGVFRWSDGRWRSVPLPDAYRDAEVFDVEIDTGGRVWIATSRGLVRLAPRTSGGAEQEP